VWLSHQHLTALLAELELSLAQPQWFKVYYQTSRIQAELEAQLRGVEVVMFPRLAQIAPRMFDEGERLHLSHRQLGNLMTDLVDAVHARKADQTRHALHHLSACLCEQARVLPSVVASIEDAMGDISGELVRVLQDTDNPDTSDAYPD